MILIMHGELVEGEDRNRSMFLPVFNAGFICLYETFYDKHTGEGLPFIQRNGRLYRSSGYSMEKCGLDHKILNTSMFYFQNQQNVDWD